MLVCIHVHVDLRWRGRSGWVTMSSTSEKEVVSWMRSFAFLVLGVVRTSGAGRTGGGGGTAAATGGIGRNAAGGG